MGDRETRRRARGRSFTLLAGAVAALSFAGSVVVGCGAADYGDSLDGATSQTSFERVFGAPRAPVWLLVVDDVADASELRDRVVSAVGGEADRRVERALRPRCGAQPDPAAWSPIDWSVVVVHPSAAGDARVVSPADNPRLRWTENRATSESVASFVAAVEDALQPVASGASFQPLAALKDIGGLLAGQRAPATERETALLASLPAASERVLMPLLALTRDDESAAEPDENVLAPSSSVEFWSPVVPRLPGQPLDACLVGNTASTARLVSWLTAQEIRGWTLWPCTGEPFARLMIEPPCTPECRRFVAAETEEGAAACLILVETPAPSCDSRFGWLDPEDDDGVRRPRTVMRDGQAHRVCEIRQLSGAALASCRESATCEACEPGWCLTDVAAIVQSCPLDRPFPLRFVGGADVAAPGTATITCNFKRESP